MEDQKKDYPSLDQLSELDIGTPNPPLLPTTQMLLVGSATVGQQETCIRECSSSRSCNNTGEVQWVNNAFNLTWGSFALVSGRVSDICDLRKAYLCGLSWCAAWLLISAFMPNVAALSAARGLAGIGHALACPAAAGVIGTYFPQGRPRTMAFAGLAGAGAIGAGIGWVLGGALGSGFPRRLFTVLVIPVMLYPIIVGYFTIPKDTPHPADRSVDWLGAGLITSAQIALTLSLSFSVIVGGWNKPVVPTLLAVSLVLFVAFAYWQVRLYKPGLIPLLPKRIFDGNRGQLLALYLASVCIFIGVDILAVNGATMLRYSTCRVGKRDSESLRAWRPILVALTLPRLPARLILVFCITFNSLCGILLALRTPNSAYWKFDLWAWMVNGFASDGMASIGGNLIANFTASGDQAVANSVLLSFGRFGAALGLALTTLLREQVASVSGVEEGLRATFWFGAGALLCGACIAVLGMRGWAIIGKA